MLPSSRILKSWLPIAFAVTVLCGLVYGAVQEDYRQSANDPQIAMAEDAATAIAGGALPQALVPSSTMNIETSLSPYIVFYNAMGMPVAGDGYLNGRLPMLPADLLKYVHTSGEDRVTWQPQADVREAIIVTPAYPSTGAAPEFVMAGRSLREVEIRENQLELFVGAAWIVALAGTFIVQIIVGVE